jgi:hypothetical protein
MDVWGLITDITALVGAAGYMNAFLRTAIQMYATKLVVGDMQV